MKISQRFTLWLTAPLLAVAILSQMAFSCGGNSFATTFRLALTASPAFIDSLNLGDKREAVVKDFTDLGSDALDFSDALKACQDNPCKVNAVDSFQVKFWDVLRRGHFSLSPKLERVQRILQGIIDSARIFYGGPARASSAESSMVVNERTLKAQLAELKQAMQP